VGSKKFTVAIDGSRLGFRAARLAAYMSDIKNGDTVRCVSVAKDMSSDDALKLITSAENQLKEGGFPFMSIAPGEVIQEKPGVSLAQLLCSAATGGHLVMGAGGMRLQKEWSESKGKSKNKSPAAATGSVAMECMAKSHAPVIITKQKATPQIDKDDFFHKRRAGEGMNVVAALSDPKEPMALKSFDMATRIVQPADSCYGLHVQGMNTTEALKGYWASECSKAGSNFAFTCVPSVRMSIDSAIIKYCDDEDGILADMIILNSAELAKADGQQIGSVSAAVAKSTEAHVLISKHFAPL